MDGASAVLYVNFDAAEHWLDKLVEQAGEADAARNVKPLSGIGMTATADGDLARIQFRVATE